MPLGVRPKIPEMQCNIKAYEIVSATDQVLATEVGDVDGLANLAVFFFVALHLQYTKSWAVK
jgi:hypothetical protein